MSGSSRQDHYAKDVAMLVIVKGLEIGRSREDNRSLRQGREAKLEREKNLILLAKEGSNSCNEV